MAETMWASEISPCSSKNVHPVHHRIKGLLRNVNPVAEISNVNFFNESMISFKLDSARLSSGLKIVIMQAGSQVCFFSLRARHSMPTFLQVFNHQFCINVTQNEHLTSEKLLRIMAAHKVNSRNPFLDDHLQLNQHQILSDIDSVVTSSSLCTSAGINIRNYVLAYSLFDTFCRNI